MTCMPGEGIGPEMMGYVKQVYKEAGVPVDFEDVQLDPTTDNYDDLYNVNIHTRTISGHPHMASVDFGSFFTYLPKSDCIRWSLDLQTYPP